MSRPILAGMGDATARLRVYIANRPDFPPYPQIQDIQGLRDGEIHQIGHACGNGWRKVFNVYAKLVFALKQSSMTPGVDCQSWQQYRDLSLLRSGSNTALVFSPPDIHSQQVLHLVMGKHYALSLSKHFQLNWLDNEFALGVETPLIVCPYFDYRQLSNVKIIRLVALIQEQIQAYSLQTNT